VFNFMLGYLNTQYNNVKPAAIKLITSILIPKENNDFVSHFLNVYHFVYQRVNETDQLEPNSFLSRIFTIYNERELISSSIVFEDYSLILQSDSRIVKNHFLTIYESFENYIHKKENRLTASLSDEILRNSNAIEENKMNMELQSEFYVEKIINFYKQFNFETKTHSKKLSNFYKFFLSFTNCFCHLGKLENNQIQNRLKIIFENALKRSEVGYAKGVVYLIKANENLPQHLKDFFKKFTEKHDIKELLITVNTSAITDSEFSVFFDILKPVLTQTFFSTIGKKNKKSVISKQKFILNFVSNMKPNFVKEFIFCLFDNLYANFFTENANSLELFCELSTGASGKLFDLIESVIDSFSLQITDMIPEIMSFLTQIFEFVENVKPFLSVEDTAHIQLLKRIKMNKRKIVNLFVKIYSKFIELDFDFHTQKIMKVSFERIENSKKENLDRIDNIIKLLMLFSEFERYKCYFLEYSHLLPVLMSYIGVKRVSKILVQKVADLIKNLIAFYPGVDEAMLKTTNDFLKKKTKSLKLKLPQNEVWCLFNPDTKEEESIVGLEIIKKHSNLILENIVCYFENTSGLSKQHQAINQPFIRELLMIVLKRIEVNNKDLIERILKILFSFLTIRKLQSLNKDRYSPNQNYDIDFQEKINQKVSHTLEIIDMIGVFCETKDNVTEFFCSHVMSLIPHINNVSVFLGFKAIYQGVSKNKDSDPIRPAVKHLSDCLEPAKKIEQSLDYDLMFNQISLIIDALDGFDETNLKIILVFIFKLLGSSDLAIRIKSNEFLQRLFALIDYLPEDSIRAKFELVVFTFQSLPTVLRLTYPSEDCLKNYVESFYLLIGFYEKHKSVVEVSQRFSELIEDMSAIKKSGFTDDFLNPKIISKTIALREFVNFKSINLSTNEDLILPIIENVLFFNLAKYGKDLKENNFRMVSSKKAHLSHLIAAVSKIIGKLTRQLSFSKLTTYIYKKLNMLQLQTEFTQPILTILSEVFENYASANASFDAVTEIHQIYSKRIEKMELIAQNASLFEKTPELTSFRRNYKQMSKGNMKSVRDSLHSQIDFGVKTNEFLIPSEENTKSDLSLKSYRGKLKNMILLKLKKMMFVHKKEEDNFELRFSVSECFLKVLRLFPVNLFKIEYAKMIMELSQLLRKKDSSVREKTMKCLFKICRITGPYLLSVCFSEIGFALAVSSYRHIRNYSIWYILNMVYVASQQRNEAGDSETKQIKFEPGCLDYLFYQVGEFMCEEKFTDMFEEKHGEDRKKKSKEIKKGKSRDVVRLLIHQTVSCKSVDSLDDDPVGTCVGKA
jgi:hypothetical protein